MREIALLDCVRLNKPVKLAELTDVIQRLLPLSSIVLPAPARLPRPASMAGIPSRPSSSWMTTHTHIREAMREILRMKATTSRITATVSPFLQPIGRPRRMSPDLDAYLPGMNGLEMLRQFRAAGHRLPAIMITGNSDVPMAVQAMKSGASDFIEKPIGRDGLVASVERALELSRDSSKISAWHETAAKHYRRPDLAATRDHANGRPCGNPSKNIAADLGISRRTVESHRASIMQKPAPSPCPPWPAWHLPLPNTE